MTRDERQKQIIGVSINMKNTKWWQFVKKYILRKEYNRLASL